MQVILTKDVLENGAVKQTVRLRRGRAIGWFAGAILDVSEETGKKLIARGDAAEYHAPAVAETAEEE